MAVNYERRWFCRTHREDADVKTEQCDFIRRSATMAAVPTRWNTHNEKCDWQEEEDYSYKWRIQKEKKMDRPWLPLFDNIWFCRGASSILLRHRCSPEDGRNGMTRDQWDAVDFDWNGEKGGVLRKKRKGLSQAHRRHTDRFYNNRKHTPHLRTYHQAGDGTLHCNRCHKTWGTRDQMEATVKTLIKGTNSRGLMLMGKLIK